MNSMEQVKMLREKTGAGVVDIKKALDEAKGDETQAILILRKRGQDKALKKGDREAHEGIIVSYVHSNNHIGVLVKLFCETDFVALNEDFRELGRDIALHIAASAPQYVKPEEVPEELVEKERSIWREQLAKENKPKEILDKIMTGKEEKFRNENALLTQIFVKDPSRTVGELLAEKIQKIGENIQVGGFVRYEM
ncbi:MAG: elongation factor Ts [Candidatus Moranbacteria bacterium CG_4_9_14_3_um_filter_45_14]|nr:MAG: elongation factor Ts [Candidatus Moranbacteria bacterium CG2_30_45_14]PJA85274.1 MAG: elongation factor Ts [Candidatus Moranbacteria bacterium CG_4_9_14_3_um_filter_45_14]